MEHTAPARYKAVGSHTQQASLNAAKTLTVPAGAEAIIMQAISQNVRIILDGTNPTASKGFQIKAGDPPISIPIPVAGTIIAIEEAASATIEWQAISYEANIR